MVIEEIKNFWEDRSFLFIFLILMVIIFLILFGGKIWLYLNYILGNDTLLQLSVDKKEIFLVGEGIEKITFMSTVTANPFCNAQCDYVFWDISTNKIIENDSFVLKLTSPLIKGYEIGKRNIGTGQELYRFEIECNSQKSFLCETSEQKTKREILITVTYNLSEEEEIYVGGLRNNLNNFSYKLDYSEEEIFYYEGVIKELEKSLILRIGENDTQEINKEIKENKRKLEELKQNWDNQEYYFVGVQYNLLNANETLKNLTILREKLNINQYNLLVKDIKNLSLEFSELKNIPLNEISSGNLNNLIIEYNQYIKKFYEKDNLENKIRNFKNLKNKTEEFSNSITLEESSLFSFENVSALNASEIRFTFNSSIQRLIFNSPIPRCCVFGNCTECCVDEKCANSEKNYPILFLHGHSFNKGLSVEFNLERFNEIQGKLEEEGYLNAGVISINDLLKDSWTKIPVPLSLKTIYYYDILKKEDNYVVIPSKNESIEIYSMRLNGIINTVKEETGRPKVTIVAHSMGGLVARKYIQLFGADSVDKIILIGTPNFGVEGYIANYCSVIGEEAECNDMITNSSFLNTLNNNNNNNSIHMIIGDGCKMRGGTGDGIVLKKNAMLPGAENYIINGTCNNLENLFHTQILDPHLYPEVYDIIKEVLKKD